MELKRLEAKKCSCCGGNSFVDLDFNLTKCVNCDTVYFVNYTKEDLAYQEYLDKKRREEAKLQQMAYKNEIAKQKRLEEERRIKEEQAKAAQNAIKKAVEKIKLYKKRTIISFILTTVFFILSIGVEQSIKPGFIFFFFFFALAFLVNLVRTIKANIDFPEVQ